MFGRLIGKIDSFVRTAILRRFNQIEGADNKKKIFISGTSYFDVLTSPENVFIDKSLLIKELLDSGK